MEKVNVKVEQKEWANPMAAGLVGLAIACGCFFAMLSGRIGPESFPLLACWLFGGFVIQIVVAILDLKSGNQTGGNTFLYFTSFFMLTGGLEMLLKYAGAMGWLPVDTVIDGYGWAVLAIVTILWTPAFWTKFSMLSIIVVLLDIAMPFIALVDLGILGREFLNISAYSLLLATILAIYLSAGLIVNAAAGRTIYPLPGVKRITKADKEAAEKATEQETAA